MTINQFFNLPQIRIDKTEKNNGKITIYASIKGKRSKCPKCEKYSYSVHDYYTRIISDLPVFQNETVILLKTRKFKCKNSDCDQKVFSEQTQAISRYSRKTVRVSKILDSLSIKLTGRLGSLLSKKLLVERSASTITRIAHKQKIPAITEPKVLGVDDWAYRKGISYGTILIDMQTSRPIDILPSREGKELKAWLENHNGIEILTRDRASSYSSAINEVCPKALQVADRFHLLMNLSDALDKYFKSISPAISKLVKSKAQEISGEKIESESIDNKIIRDKMMSNKEHSKYDERMEVFTKVKELQRQKVPIKKIARSIGICRNTVRTYFLQETLAPRSHTKSTNIEIFSSYISSRLKEKGCLMKDIIEKIYDMGYNGGKTQAYYNINEIKNRLNILTPGLLEDSHMKIAFVKPLSSRKLSKYIGISLNSIKDKEERTYVRTLIENIPELKIVRKLVQIFKTTLRRGIGNIKRWIEFIQRSKYKLTGLRSFASGLLKDIDAVENGIKMPWSNGAVEGHVNRIKSIKRQMYGRASVMIC
jgi:transposase